MPSSGASWRTRERIRAAPLDKQEPRSERKRTSSTEFALIGLLGSFALMELSEIRVRQVSYSRLYES